MSLLTNLIAYWKLDEASGNALDSVGSNDLTDNGSCGSATGLISNARTFDASKTQYFTHADNSDLSTGDIDWTFACWINAASFADTSGYHAIAAKGPWNSPGTDSEWIIYRDGFSSGLTFQVCSGTTQSVVGATNFGTLSTSTWYHVVVWHDSVNNEIGIAINAGTPNTLAHSTGVNDGTTGFEIASSVSAGLYWNGTIDEAGFWKRVLTSTERSDLYNGGAGLAYSGFGGGSANATVNPSSVSATWTPVAPAVSAGATVAPAATVTAWTPNIPAVSGGSIIAPTSVSSSWTASTPSVSTSGSVTVSLSSITASWTVTTPSVAGEADPDPLSAVASWTVNAPAVTAGATVAPSTITAHWTAGAPTVSAGATITVSPPFCSWVAGAPSFAVIFGYDDNFNGASGTLIAHVADTGQPWGPAGATYLSLNGAGSIYPSSAFPGDGSIAISDYVPSSADYRASIKLGLSWFATGGAIGPAVRASGSYGSQSYYAIQVYGPPGGSLDILRCNAGTVVAVGSTQTLATSAADDEVTLAVRGTGSAVTLIAFHKGVEIYTVDDTSGSRITSTGSIGLRVATGDASHSDQVRELTAGPIELARRFDNPSAQLIDFGATTVLHGATGVMISFWMRVEAGATTMPGAGTVYGIVQQNGSVAADTCFFGVYTNLYTGTTGQLLWAFSDGLSHYQQWVPTTDFVAGWDGDGRYHHILVQWNCQGYLHMCADGVDVPLTVVSTGFISAMGTPASHLSIGSQFGGWNTFGMSFAAFKLWRWTPGAGDVMLYTPMDVSNLAGCCDPYVIEIAADVDTVPIHGTNPEVGNLAVLSGTVTGTTVVEGPNVGPPYSAVVAVNRSGIAHSPGNLILTFTWQRGAAPGSSVIFTPTCAIGTFVPSTVTLSSSGSDSQTTTLTVGSGHSPTAYHVDVTNDGGLANLNIPFEVRLPDTLIPSAHILPSGNVACLFATNTSGDPTGITVGDTTNATVIINGGSPIAVTNLVYDSVNNFIWWPLNKIWFIAIIDDAAASFSGSWSTTALFSDGRVPYGGTVAISTDPTATGTFIFTGLTPGLPYELSSVWLDIYRGSDVDLNSRTPTTGARYAVTDGTTTTHIDFDQSVSPPYDRSDLLKRWFNIGTYTPVGTTLTITISNQAGMGELMIDALRLEHVIPRIVNPGDVVTIHFDDYGVQAHAGAAGPVNLTATVETDSTWWPFDPLLPRNMGIGYNPGGQSNTSMSHVIANYAKQCGDFKSINPWSNATTDAYGVMTGYGNPSNPNELEFVHPTGGNGSDQWGLVTAPDAGPFTFRFRTPGDPNLSLKTDNSVLTLTPPSPGYAGGPDSGVPIVYQQNYTKANLSLYNPGFTLQVRNNGSPSTDIVTGLEILDSATPSNWTKVTHPIFFDRMNNGTTCRFPNGRIRFLNFANTNAADGVDWPADFHRVGDASYATASRIDLIPILSIEPITGIADAIYAGESLIPGDAPGGVAEGNNVIVLVTASSAHNLTTGQQIQFGGLASRGPFDDTSTTTHTPGITLGPDQFPNGSGLSILVLDATRFVVLVPSTGGAHAPTRVPITLASAVTMNGGEYVGHICQNGAPFETQVTVCNETGMGYWLQLPPVLSDLSIHALIRMVESNLTPGLILGVEESNEDWNNTSGGLTGRYGLERARQAQYDYVQSGGAIGLNNPSTADPAAWFAWKTGRSGQITKAAWTGIPAVLIDGYMAPLNNATVQTGAVLEAVVNTSTHQVSGINIIHGGSGYTGTPTLTVFGGLGSGATATATVAGGVITGVTMGSHGTGYTLTGRTLADLKIIMGSQAGGPGVTDTILYSCWQYRIDFDELAIDYYQANHPEDSSFGATIGGAVYPIWDYLRPLDVTDLTGLYFIRGDRPSVSRVHIDHMNSATFGTPSIFANVKLVGYEGGISQMCLYGSADPGGADTRRVHKGLLAAADPRMFNIELAWKQYLEHTIGFDNICDFVLDDPTGLGSGGWPPVFMSDDSLVGTGTAGENPYPDDLRSVMSEIGGGHRAYAMVSAGSVNIHPAVIPLSWVANAPAATANATVTISTVTAHWTAGAPSVSTTGSVTVSPSTISASWTANSPSVSAGGSISIAPSAVPLSWVASNPAVVATRTVTVAPSGISASWTANVPAVAVDCILSSIQPAFAHWQPPRRILVSTNETLVEAIRSRFKTITELNPLTDIYKNKPARGYSFPYMVISLINGNSDFNFSQETWNATELQFSIISDDDLQAETLGQYSFTALLPTDPDKYPPITFHRGYEILRTPLYWDRLTEQPARGVNNQNVWKYDFGYRIEWGGIPYIPSQL